MLEKMQASVVNIEDRLLEKNTGLCVQGRDEPSAIHWLAGAGTRSG